MGVNQGIDIQTMREVISAARTKFKKGFRETQRIRDYVIQREVMKRAVSDTPEHGYEWSLRIKAAQGSTAMLDAFEQITYVRDTYDTSLKVTPRTVVTHKNAVYDKLAQLINEKATDKIWRDVQMKESAAAESEAELWEEKFRDPPFTEASKDGILGWLYWLRRSQTSGGVFTEQLEPQYNGVYYRDGSGSLVSTIAGGKDLTNAAYGRLRSLVGTHRGVLNDQMLGTIRNAIEEMGWRYIDGLKGDKTALDPMLFWDDTFHRAYKDLVKALGSPLKADYFPTNELSLNGVEPMQTPSLNSHFLRPVFVINMADLKFRKLAGGWGMEGYEAITAFSDAFPIANMGQQWAENNRAAGALIHGTFTTGT